MFRVSHVDDRDEIIEKMCIFMCYYDRNGKF